MNDLTDRYRRIDAWQHHIKAFVELADQADSTPSAEGALSGLTVGIKDIIDVKGIPTRNGSAVFAKAKPAEKDAEVVERLRAAGGTIIGKTVTTEFAFTDPTDCRNPHDFNRSPGGSSSGSGAAVGAGLVDIALGTQTAGSLCRPAAYCGVVGLKPSYGSLPTTGVSPLSPSFDTVGIIARSVDLARRAFIAMKPDLPPAASNQVTKLKVTQGLFDTELAPTVDYQAGMDLVAEVFRGFGSTINKQTLPAAVDEIVLAHRLIMNFEAAQAHGELLRGEQYDKLKPNFRSALLSGVDTTESDVAKAREFLAERKSDFWSSLADIDLVLTLPVPEGAPLMDGTTGFQHWLTLWSVFGGPLISLPWGLDSLHRPRSIMLAGHPGADLFVLDIAEQLMENAPPIPKPILP